MSPLRDRVEDLSLLVDELKKSDKDLRRAQKTLDEVGGKNGASQILGLDRSILRAPMRKLGIVKL